MGLSWTLDTASSDQWLSLGLQSMQSVAPGLGEAPEVTEARTQSR